MKTLDKKPLEWAVIVFCSLLPTYLLRFAIPIPGTGFAIPTTLLEVLFWLLFLFWLSAKKHFNTESIEHFRYPLVLLITASIISVAVSPDLRGAIGLWRAYILEPILFYVIYRSVITTHEARQKTVLALATTTILIGVTTVVQKITGFGIPNPVWQAVATRRVTSFYGFPNAIALLIAPLIPLFLSQIISIFHSWGHERTDNTRDKEKKEPANKVPQYVWKKIGMFSLATLLGALSIIFAKSAGGMIGMTIGGIIVLLAHKKLRLLAVASLIAIPIIFATVPPAKNYFQKTITGQNDSSSVRKIIWNETMAMLRDRPVFGSGLAGYPKIILPYHKADYIEIFQYPHNEILNFWSELGLLGLAAFVWLVVVFFQTIGSLLLRIQKTVKKHAKLGTTLATPNRYFLVGLLAAGVTLLVHGMVDVPYFKNDLAMLTWIFFGLLESIRIEFSLRNSLTSPDTKEH